MKPIPPPPPDPGCPPRARTPLPRLWPHLEPERQRHIAQCLAQLILRLHGMPQEPAPREASHEPPA
jgi:hypothetical protein